MHRPDLGAAARCRLARGLIRTYLSPPYFPVPFEQFPAEISFNEILEDTWQIDDLRIATVPVCHPGSTVGYRLSQNGNSLAYIPDNEPALDRRAGLPVAGDADVLFHDAQFTDAEYRARVGWGHAAVSDFVTYLAEAAPRRALMFHHDPAHSDAQLEAMLAEVRGGRRRPAPSSSRTRDSSSSSASSTAASVCLGWPHVRAC